MAIEGKQVARAPIHLTAATVAGLTGIGLAVWGLSAPVTAVPRDSAVQQTHALAGKQSSVGHSRVVAGGMAAIDRRWPDTPKGYDDFETPFTVTKEPGSNGHTYWAHQWSYQAKGSEGGYVGLQQRSGDDKYVNFSIWGASSWRDLNSGTSCRPFGHEGSGVQCDAKYDWKENVEYRIKISQVDDKSWKASIFDTSSGSTTNVATIVLPDNRGGLSSLSQWVENYAQGDEQPKDCGDVPSAVAVYGVPTANGGTVKPIESSAHTYGNCASIAKADCAEDQVCTLSVNQG